MKTGYFFIKDSNDNLAKWNSHEVRDFFLDLIENERILFDSNIKIRPYETIPSSDLKSFALSRGKSISEIVDEILNVFPSNSGWRRMALLSLDYKPIIFCPKSELSNLPNEMANSFEQYCDLIWNGWEPVNNQNISILEYIKTRIKANGFDDYMNWFIDLLDENIAINGFKMTKNPYCKQHQNLFQDNYKIGGDLYQDYWDWYEEINQEEYINSFILEKTDKKEDILYLCKKRSCNPYKFRLVLKSHQENNIIGILFPKNDGNLIEKELQVEVPINILEIEHFMQFSDEDIFRDYLSKEKKQLTETKIQLKEKGVTKAWISVQGFYRGGLKGNGLIECEIGNKRAEKIKKIKLKGKETNVYFGTINKLKFNDNFVNEPPEHNCFGQFLRTCISKQGIIYIMVYYFLDSWLKYGETNNNEMPPFYLYKEKYAEQGYSEEEINNMYIKEEAENIKSYRDEQLSERNDLNWNNYNDLLDMDQQSQDFW